MQGRHKRRPANAHTNYTLYTYYAPYKYYTNCTETKQCDEENNIYVNFTQESMTQTKLTPVRQTLFSYLMPLTYHTCVSSSHIYQPNLIIITHATKFIFLESTNDPLLSCKKLGSYHVLLGF